MRVPSPASGANAIVRIAPGVDVQTVVAAHPAGTTFLLGAGVHRLQSIVPRDGDTFLGEPGAVLSGARVIEGFERQGDLWVLGDQTQQVRPSGYCRPWGPGERVIQCSYPEQLFIDDQSQVQVGDRSEVEPGTWYFDYDADEIVIAIDPSEHVVETSITPLAFSGDAQDVTVRGLVIERYANRSQTGAIEGDDGRGWVIQGNELRWNHGYGVRIGDDMVVRSNRIHHNGQLGIGGSGDHVLVAGNEIAFNNTANFAPGWEAGGSKFVNTTDLVLRDNWVHRNGGRGIWTDVDNIGTVIEGNVVEWNDEAGIVHEISYGAVIRGNIARFNGIRFDQWLWGSQILVQNSSDVLVTDNLAVVHSEGGDGIGIINQTRHEDEGHAPWVSANVSVVGNTIINLGLSGHSGIVDDSVSRGAACSEGFGNTFERNTYYFVGLRPDRWEWCGQLAWSGLQAMGAEHEGSVHPGSTAGVQPVGSACCNETGWPIYLGLHQDVAGVQPWDGSTYLAAADPAGRGGELPGVLSTTRAVEAERQAD